MRRAAGRRALAVAVLAGTLAGCGTLGTIAGAVTGVASSAATGNAAVGIAVAVGVKTATDAALKTRSRRAHAAEQDRIATAAGPLAAGEQRDWAHRGMLGFGSRHGQVRVERLIETPLGACKEILFTIAAQRSGDDDAPLAAAAVAPASDATGPGWFAATICRDAQGWRWASAEPATERWGTLQ